MNVQNIQLLTDEITELYERVNCWKNNCESLTNLVSKLTIDNKNLASENAQLKSKIDKNVEQTSKDVSYLMAIVEKKTQQIVKLKAENAKLSELQNGTGEGKHAEGGVHERKSTLAEDEDEKWKAKLREKNELIRFYKETCDAKVTEIIELQQLNKILVSKVSKIQQQNKLN